MPWLASVGGGARVLLDGGRSRPQIPDASAAVLGQLDDSAARWQLVDGVKHALAAAGAWILYLPPYSPDLNPIA
jgi:hypothetical protein